MSDTRNVYERKNSVFLLACPPNAISISGRKLRIQKHIIRRLVNQFYKAGIEPYLVGTDKWFAEIANLLINTKTDRDIPEMILSTSICWEGNSMFLLANKRYDNHFINNFRSTIFSSAITFYETSEGNKSSLVGIGVHSSAIDIFQRCITMAANDNKLTIDEIYKIFDSYKDLIYTEHGIDLVLREAVLHTKQNRQYSK